MTQVNRETLRGYFGRGKMPVAEHFGDLVDSTLNIMDDGFERTEKNGIQLAPLEDKGPVLEFFCEIQDTEPLWMIEVDKRNGCLSVERGGDKQPVLTLYPEGKVAWHGDLEVEGVLAARSFKGNYHSGEVDADGVWHDITKEDGEEKSGCRAYRVIAGCGVPGKGKYALMEATAMHCFGRRQKIQSLQSWFGIHFNRIQLRWERCGIGWRLQLRTRRNYGMEVKLRFRVTELWDDYYFGS